MSKLRRRNASCRSEVACSSSSSASWMSRSGDLCWWRLFDQELSGSWWLEWSVESELGVAALSGACSRDAGCDTVRAAFAVLSGGP